MSNGISSVGGCSAAMQTTRAQAKLSSTQVSSLVDQAFSKIDTKNQGYLDSAELETALGQIGGSGDTSASADAIVKALDGDNDGKVTKQEMTDGLEKLSSALDSQFDGMRTRGSGHRHDGPPPGGDGAPPPGADGAGLTKDQLTAMAKSASDSGSEAADSLNSLAGSFEAADTDGDGKVSFKEAQAFRESSESGSTGSTGSATSQARNQDRDVMRHIMRLVASYGATDSQSQSQSTVAATA